jgi:hypothetical protein
MSPPKYVQTLHWSYLDLILTKLELVSLHSSRTVRPLNEEAFVSPGVYSLASFRGR